jgi:drug/metabolite transporter (DMT)-like permease
LPGWVPIDRGHWPVLAGLAVTGAAGQFAITEAFRRGEASVVAPFEYTALGWGIMLDGVLWSTPRTSACWAARRSSSARALT